MPTGLIELETKQERNIEFVEGCYRYVNHHARFATAGYPKKDKLLEMTFALRFDEATRRLMSARYERIYGGEQS